MYIPVKRAVISISMRAFRVYENFVHLFYICVISQRQTPEEETMTASELEDTEHCGRISLSRLVKVSHCNNFFK